jgi:hypothetical protein
MKIFALMPAKNEEWVLRTTLPQLRRFADEIIVLDGHSEDQTANLVREHGGIVLKQEGTTTNYSGWRQQLLEEARRRQATHVIWLDADEAFTAQFLKTFRQRLQDMQPGQKLILDWLCLWKDPRQFRDDHSVWSHNPKDFVFCDDGRAAFTSARLHEGRTPGSNELSRLVRIPRDEGAVLHFQFVPFDYFQMKQAFMRCREWLLKTGPAWQINEKYAITLDDPSARCEHIPAAWQEGLVGLDTLRSATPGFYQHDVLRYFAQEGPAFFEPLEIWHLPALREQFVTTLGREPVSATRPGPIVRLAARVQRKAARLWNEVQGTRG